MRGRDSGNRTLNVKQEARRSRVFFFFEMMNLLTS